MTGGIFPCIVKYHLKPVLLNYAVLPYDKILFSLPSLADSWKNSLIEDELRKDVLLDEEDSESVDINEILDMAADAAAEALADLMDFVSVDTKASEISRKLYSSAGKKVSKEAKKEVVKEAVSEVGEKASKEAKKEVVKEAVSEVGEKALKKEVKEIIDDAALKHSTVGDFTINPKTGALSKMKGGGHGQANIDFLDKNGIKYNIIKEYPNGVRVGNVPSHKTKAKRTGINQSWFTKETLIN